MSSVSRDAGRGQAMGLGGQMRVADIEGRNTIVEGVNELDALLSSARKGDDGAFILWHGDGDGGPMLWIEVNKDGATLWYAPDDKGDHPGYVPTGMTPTGHNEQIRFLLTAGGEGSAIWANADAFVSVEIAYQAAREFLRDPALPACISWFEL